MRRGTVLVAASAVVALAIAAPALSRPQTTNPGAFETVKVIITDGSITVRPKVSGRGVTGIFILTNRGKNAHTFVIGDTTRGPGKNIGFSRMLRPGQQRTIVLFLDYRGVLPYHIPGGTSKMRGVFTIK